MQASHKLYTVRPGTIDSGKEYEFKMAALVCLRCISQGVSDMWIVSNANDVGAFDDIVLHIQTATDSIVYQVQLKHMENPDVIKQKEFFSQNTKESFSLLKYSKDIADLEQSINSHKKGIIEDLGPFSNIYFVLFTNRNVSQYKFLDKNADQMWSILNTKPNCEDIYKIDFTKVPVGIKPGGMATFSKVFLFANQLGAKDIDELIIQEMSNILYALNIDYKSISKDFVKYVTDWAKGCLGNSPDRYYYLTKQEVVYKLTELFLRHYEMSLSEHQLVAYDDPKKCLWNMIAQDERLTIIDLNDSSCGFLPQYVWSEVKRYCKKFSITNFADSFSTKDKGNFFQAIDDCLERQMLKIIGSYDNITALDVYKGRWSLRAATRQSEHDTVTKGNLYIRRNTARN